MVDYEGRNFLSSAYAYRQRKKYKENATSDLPEGSTIDLWYEKPNYGLINQDFEPVVLSVENDSSLRYFEKISDSVKAANFVTDAFIDFRKEYMELIQNSPINTPPFVGGVTPIKGYEEFGSSYAAYMETTIDFYVEELNLMNPAASYMDFEQAFLKIAAPTVYNFPVTRSGFVLSPHCSVNVSGLYVELSELEYDDDFHKGKILNSLDFFCFLENANKFGFAIDKNAPWRLIADLSSPVMQQYIKNYEPNKDYDEILENLYREKTQEDDLYSLTNMVLSVYNRFVEKNPIAFSKVHNPTTSETTTIGEIRTAVNFTRDGLNVEYWLSLLLKVRLMELGKLEHFSEKEYRVLEVHRTYGMPILERNNRRGTGGIHRDNTPENYLKPAINAIGKICSEYIREIYTRNIDSDTKTTLGDYYDF